MWKNLINLARDVFDISNRVKGHDQKLERLYAADGEALAEIYRLSERMLRLELELQHTKEAHARDFTQLKEEHAREREHLQQRQLADRDNFRLQIENLILRLQRGLPPPELPEKLPEKLPESLDDQ